jgi:type II secretory pathway pseudopilin PulG
MRSHRTQPAFTLPDLIILIALLAIVLALSAIIIPRTRTLAGDPVNAARLASLAAATQHYATDFRSYPPASVLGDSATGLQWSVNNQLSANPVNGWIHWSGMYSGLNYITDAATFTSTSAPRGGLPRQNPGPTPSNWEPGQINMVGAGSPAATPADRQAPRVAFVPNGAIFSRNKFVSSGSPRTSRLYAFTASTKNISPSAAAGATSITSSNATLASPDAPTVAPSNTILMTEALWTTNSAWTPWTNDGSLYSSHRPITPFLGRSAGLDVFSEPNGSSSIPRFAYPNLQDILPTSALSIGALTQTNTELNAVHRDPVDGLACFLFTDGHVERTSVGSTLSQRRWGEKFHTISGNQTVYRP